MRVLRCAESFYGNDIRTLHVNYLLQARAGSFPVNDYRTGAALAFAVTGLLRAGKAELFAQQVEQD
jgi:hypothetical protein